MFEEFFDLWEKEEDTRKIITQCKKLDERLEGGIEIGKITEFCGGSGSGKTQMCMQLCINVQFPQDVGGVGGKAIYIDTNQDFHPERLKQMALCKESHFRTAFEEFYTQTSSQCTFNCDTILKNVSYVYCCGYTELIATVIQLQQMQDPWLKLVIIDSFSFPLRHIEDVSRRTAIVYELLTDLHQLALDSMIAVVITNELTTRFIGDSYKIVPALGATHSHKINERIVLSKDESSGERHWNIGKNMNLLEESVKIKITEKGVRET